MTEILTRLGLAVQGKALTFHHISTAVFSMLVITAAQSKLFYPAVSMEVCLAASWLFFGEEDYH